MEYRKFTEGFVSQHFVEREDGSFVCDEQNFTCGDEVSREDEDGERIAVNTDKEIYRYYDMVQPGVDYYVVGVTERDHPVLHGPFGTKERRLERFNELMNSLGCEQTFFIMDVSAGAKIEL